MDKSEFINLSDLIFTDISSELYRNYHFNNGEDLFISAPLFLNVSKSGGHRLIDNAGICYYIQPAQGWYITWSVSNGNPHFVK